MRRELGEGLQRHHRVLRGAEAALAVPLSHQPLGRPGGVHPVAALDEGQRGVAGGLDVEAGQDVDGLRVIAGLRHPAAAERLDAARRCRTGCTARAAAPVQPVLVRDGQRPSELVIACGACPLLASSSA